MILSVLLISLFFALWSEVSYDFTDMLQNESLELFSFQGHVPPQLGDGYLMLMDGRYASNHNNAVVFPDIINDTAAVETYLIEMAITPGGKGAGLVLLNREFISPDSVSYKADSWEVPDFPGSLGIGFNVYNPRTSAWFDEYGNFYGREEREISLHWDGREIYRVKSPYEFRSETMSIEFHVFKIEVKYVVAGAKISICLDEDPVIENYFIPELFQYYKTPVIGSSTCDLTSFVYLRSFSYETAGIVPDFSRKASVDILVDEVFHAGRREIFTEVDMSAITDDAYRVIMTLELGAPAGGFSAWDVGAAIYVMEEDSTLIEICRYITPYHRGYTWKFEVSDFLPLFSGVRTLFAKVDTWEQEKDDPSLQKGWKVNASLDFYGSSTDLSSFKVLNLWSGFFEYGNPENPMENKFDEISVSIPEQAKSGKIRIVVTGHGMAPNTGGAAEFMPAERTLIINGKVFENLLWNTDCYLNPCRPQGGTWKFDRAGWAPGSIVQSWDIDLTEFILDNDLLTFEYIPMDYVNENRGEHFPPHHWVESQVIFYK